MYLYTNLYLDVDRDDRNRDIKKPDEIMNLQRFLPSPLRNYLQKIGDTCQCFIKIIQNRMKI